MDAQIGRLRGELRKLNVASNTLLWFNSDNGGDRLKDNFDLGQGKGTISEGGTRVPAIVEWPDRMSPGVIDGVAISTNDFYPTLLAAAGVNEFGPQRVIDGENVLPILARKSGKRVKPIFFWEDRRQAVHLGQYKLIRERRGDTIGSKAYDVVVRTSRGAGLGEEAPDHVEDELEDVLLQWIESVRKDAGEVPEHLLKLEFR
jgi:arylsulfatase A-like enzyme